jgi:glucosamine-6-phosphate deaminase
MRVPTIGFKGGISVVIKKNGNMSVIIAEDYDALSAAAADIIETQIRVKAESVLGMATGSTPVGTYKELVAKRPDFSKVLCFNLDEYYPIKACNNQSYSYFMKQNLFNHVNINLNNVHIPSGEADDPVLECLRYEDMIRDAGGIDLQLLGLGLNGHIGFNEPDTFFPKTTHFAPLAESTIAANARFFDSADEVPKHAITMGIGTIFAAKHILLLISGKAKADIAEAVIQGDITPQVPGSVLQLHKAVTVILDREAAKNI